MEVKVSENFDVLNTNYKGKRGMILEGGSRLEVEKHTL